MTRKERLELLKGHIQKASRDWLDALDAVCHDPNTQASRGGLAVQRSGACAPGRGCNP
jgi:hypothetical protein